MIGPQDVGHRVVVRRVVGLRDGRPIFTDILGELLSFTADEAVVAGRTGEVRVPLAAIVAAKRIPPSGARSGPGGPSSAPRSS